jgi:hypothetical protein
MVYVDDDIQHRTLSWSLNDFMSAIVTKSKCGYDLYLSTFVFGK